ADPRGRRQPAGAGGDERPQRLPGDAVVAHDAIAGLAGDVQIRDAVAVGIGAEAQADGRADAAAAGRDKRIDEGAGGRVIAADLIGALTGNVQVARAEDDVALALEAAPLIDEGIDEGPGGAVVPLDPAGTRTFRDRPADVESAVGTKGQRR